MKITAVFHLLILSIVFAGGVFAQSDFEVTKALAESGDAVAQNNLGHLYELGEGVPQNDVEAVKWWRLAADQGNASALENLSIMYGNGEAVSKDDAEAVKLYTLAAVKGDATAQYYLGAMYRNGKGVQQNDSQAYVWFSVSARQGNGNAKESAVIASNLLSPLGLSKAQARATICFESNYKNCTISFTSDSDRIGSSQPVQQTVQQPAESRNANSTPIRSALRDIDPDLRRSKPNLGDILGLIGEAIGGSDRPVQSTPVSVKCVEGFYLRGAIGGYPKHVEEFAGPQCPGGWSEL